MILVLYVDTHSAILVRKRLILPVFVVQVRERSNGNWFAETLCALDQIVLFRENSPDDHHLSYSASNLLDHIL